MATKLKPVEVVTVGVGLTGTILAKELADSGLKVVGLERGGWRDTHPDFDMPGAHDELRYARRHELMQDLSRETITFRNAIADTALPMRQMGSFLPGEGVGGGWIGAASSGGRPIDFRPVPSGTPRWGSEWKKATARYYNRAFGITTHGACQSYRGNYFDLDPTYRDAYGLPLLRMTFDFRRNEYKMSDYMTKKAAEIAKAAGASRMNVNPRTGKYSIVPYQSTHNTGGAVMGADPKTSAVNKYLQSWDVHNLFVVGAGNFPQNGGYNPTGTVGALTYQALEAIKTKYLQKPGALV